MRRREGQFVRVEPKDEVDRYDLEREDRNDREREAREQIEAGNMELVHTYYAGRDGFVGLVGLAGA